MGNSMASEPQLVLVPIRRLLQHQSRYGSGNGDWLPDLRSVVRDHEFRWNLLCVQLPLPLPGFGLSLRKYSASEFLELDRYRALSADGLVAIDSKGNLFASGNADGSFFEVNTSNASSTLIGNTGLTGLFSGSFVGSTLYGISTNQFTGAESIVTIDTSNASVTQGPLISNLPLNYEITSMTASAVPEPSSIILGLVSGLASLAWRSLRRRPFSSLVVSFMPSWIFTRSER